MVDEKIIIAGSRSFDNYNMLRKIMSELRPVTGYLELVSGTAKGADKLGEKWAKDKQDVPIKKFPADWEEYGKSAGHIRNQEMAEYADTLIAFWDGESSGTKSMIDKALKEGLEIHVFQF